METTLQGTFNGKQIELDQILRIPKGTRVTIKIEIPELSQEERRRLIRQGCGAWADDPSIPEIFAEIDRQRHTEMPREISFDEAP